jgi:hypothetical protein
MSSPAASDKPPDKPSDLAHAATVDEVAEWEDAYREAGHAWGEVRKSANWLPERAGVSDEQ